MYAAFKHLHVLFVLISISLFLFRFVLLLLDSPLLKKKWLKIVPHVNDTLLLCGGYHGDVKHVPNSGSLVNR